MINWNRFLTIYRSWRRNLLYPLISVFVAVGLCLYTPIPTKAIESGPLTPEDLMMNIQLSNVSSQQEVELGKQMDDQLHRQDVRISRNQPLTEYIQGIGRRLAAHSDRRDITYIFQVVEDNSVNAFATLGGYVYLNTGLIKAADNEAELASVMAHEMGHIEGKHLLKQMRQNAIKSGVYTAAGVDSNSAVAIGVELALSRTRSRPDEYDADNKGLRILTRAGYAPSAMVSFMQKLLGVRSVPTILSTHPNTSNRVQSLQRQIDANPSSNNNGLDSAAYRKIE